MLTKTFTGVLSWGLRYWLSASNRFSPQSSFLFAFFLSPRQSSRFLLQTLRCYLPNCSQPRMLNFQVRACWFPLHGEPQSPANSIQLKLMTPVLPPQSLLFHAIHLLVSINAQLPTEIKHLHLFPYVKSYRAFWSLISLNTSSLIHWSESPFPLYPLLITPIASDRDQVLLLSCLEYCSSLLLSHQFSRITLLKH